MSIPSSMLLSLALIGSAPFLLDTCEGSGTPAPEPPTGVGEDLFMTGDDFQCITQGEKVRSFYLWNELGHLDEALEVANNPRGGTYPIGTVLQLIPSEAMVKRYEGFSPESNDWEYFYLDVEETGTTVLDRGATNPAGPLGVNNAAVNCHNCHVQAEPQWDLVCEDGHGCDPLPFSDSQIEVVQSLDPRCP